MKKIILSNFLETKENYELFKEKIESLDLNHIFDSFLFHSTLTKPEKIEHIIAEIFDTNQNLKKIIELLDYSTLEKQMLIFCYNSTDRYGLMKLLKIDLLADLVNYKWSETEQIYNNEAEKLSDETYNDLQVYLQDIDTDLDFWFDKDNEVIYFVFGDALISYSKETGGFSIMKIWDYDNLEILIGMISEDKQPIINSEFTDEFFATIDTSNTSDFENIGNIIDPFLIEGQTLWSDPEESYEEYLEDEEEITDEVPEDPTDIEIKEIDNLIAATCTWYGYSNQMLNAWYDVNDTFDNILNTNYPWKQSFDEYLAEIIQTLNEETTTIPYFSVEYWNTKNQILNNIERKSIDSPFSQLVTNFVDETRNYITHIKSVDSNVFKNPSISKLFTFINITLTDESVEAYLEYLEENIKQNKFD